MAKVRKGHLGSLREIFFGNNKGNINNKETNSNIVSKRETKESRKGRFRALREIFFGNSSNIDELVKKRVEGREKEFKEILEIYDKINSENSSNYDINKLKVMIYEYQTKYGSRQTDEIEVLLKAKYGKNVADVKTELEEKKTTLVKEAQAEVREKTFEESVVSDVTSTDSAEEPLPKAVIEEGSYENSMYEMQEDADEQLSNDNDFLERIGEVRDAYGRYTVESLTARGNAVRHLEEMEKKNKQFSDLIMVLENINMTNLSNTNLNDVCSELSLESRIKKLQENRWEFSRYVQNFDELYTNLVFEQRCREIFENIDRYVERIDEVKNEISQSEKVTETINSIENLYEDFSKSLTRLTKIKIQEEQQRDFEKFITAPSTERLNDISSLKSDELEMLLTYIKNNEQKFANHEYYYTTLIKNIEERLDEISIVDDENKSKTR